MSLDPQIKKELHDTATELRRSFDDELKGLAEFEKGREDKLGKKVDAQQQLLMQLLVSEQERSKRRKFWLGIVAAPGGILAAITAIALAYIKATAPPETKVEDVRQQVEKAEEAVTQMIEKRVAETDAKLVDVERAAKNNNDIIERLVEIQLDQQVQMTEASNYIADKIEKAHPKTKSVEEPDSLREGRRRAKAIKANRKFEYDPMNPFKDLK